MDDQEQHHDRLDQDNSDSEQSLAGRLKRVTFDDNPSVNVIEDDDAEEAILNQTNLNQSKPKKQARQQPRTVEEAKRELDRREWLRSETQKIIESLLDGRKELNSLRRSLSLLNKQEYDDVTTERSIEKLCGYPLCDGVIIENTKPKQKLKIDVRNKKIFNVNERFKFCSIFCLEASGFLMEQLSDESLWIRYQERLGFEDLYVKGEAIQFMPYSQPNEQQQSSNENENKVSMKDSVSFPYIKPEHLAELKHSANQLIVKERKMPNQEPILTNHSNG